MIRLPSFDQLSEGYTLVRDTRVLLGLEVSTALEANSSAQGLEGTSSLASWFSQYGPSEVLSAAARAARERATRVHNLCSEARRAIARGDEVTAGRLVDDALIASAPGPEAEVATVSFPGGAGQIAELAAEYNINGWDDLPSEPILHLYQVRQDAVSLLVLLKRVDEAFLIRNAHYTPWRWVDPATVFDTLVALDRIRCAAQVFDDNAFRTLRDTHYESLSLDYLARLINAHCARNESPEEDEPDQVAEFILHFSTKDGYSELVRLIDPASRECFRKDLSKWVMRHIRRHALSFHAVSEFVESLARQQGARDYNPMLTEVIDEARQRHRAPSPWSAREKGEGFEQVMDLLLALRVTDSLEGAAKEIEQDTVYSVGQESSGPRFRTMVQVMDHTGDLLPADQVHALLDHALRLLEGVSSDNEKWQLIEYLIEQAPLEIVREKIEYYGRRILSVASSLHDAIRRSRLALHVFEGLSRGEPTGAELHTLFQECTEVIVTNPDVFDRTDLLYFLASAAVRNGVEVSTATMLLSYGIRIRHREARLKVKAIRYEIDGGRITAAETLARSIDPHVKDGGRSDLPIRDKALELVAEAYRKHGHPDDYRRIRHDDLGLDPEFDPIQRLQQNEEFDQNLFDEAVEYIGRSPSLDRHIAECRRKLEEDRNNDDLEDWSAGIRYGAAVSVALARNRSVAEATELIAECDIQVYGYAPLDTSERPVCQARLVLCEVLIAEGFLESATEQCRELRYAFREWDADRLVSITRSLATALVKVNALPSIIGLFTEVHEAVGHHLLFRSDGLEEFGRFLEAALPVVENSEIQDLILSHAVRVAGLVENHDGFSGAADRLANAMAEISDTALLTSIWECPLMTPKARSKVMSSYQTALIKSHRDNSSLLRFSAQFDALSVHGAWSSVASLLGLHVRSDRVDHVNAITTACADYGLTVLKDLFTGEPHGFHLTNLQQWIDTIADEDDRDQILLWARRVRKGTMSEEEFHSSVARFLPRNHE